jgi:hypothetical protein
MMTIAASKAIRPARWQLKGNMQAARQLFKLKERAYCDASCFDLQHKANYLKVKTIRKARRT